MNTYFIFITIEVNYLSCYQTNINQSYIEIFKSNSTRDEEKNDHTHTHFKKRNGKGQRKKNNWWNSGFGCVKQISAMHFFSTFSHV